MPVKTPPPSRLLKSGEFADLCGTTKETILHFDRKGVLRPRRVTGSRYREYHPEQIYEYEFIALMQRTGATLEDIRRLKLESDTLAVDALVERGIDRLRTEAARLLTLADDFERRLYEVREILAAPRETLVLSDEAEFRCSATRIDMPPDKSYVDWFRTFCERRTHEGLSRILPAGMLLSSEGLLHGEQRPLAFITDVTDGPDQLILPAGRTASWFFTGTETDFIKSLGAFAEALRTHGLEPAGDALLLDGASYLKHPVNHIAAKIVLRVR